MSRIFDCSDPDQRAEGIKRAIDAVNAGELVVMPTDTVYGIGADAFTPTAVAKLLAAKHRGRDMPVPVLVGSAQNVEGLVTSLPPLAKDLMETFWPGGLTLVIRQAPSLRWDLGETDGTVAVRMPEHPVALELLTATGPMAVSSANLSGQPPAATAAKAQEQLADSVSIYLEAGPTPDQVPSTIVDLSSQTPRILRTGAISAAALAELIPQIASEQ